MPAQPYLWADYVLKTANNWQGPIKDFELDVQQTKEFTLDMEETSRKGGDQPKDYDRWWVDFCWQGPVERIAPNHVRVKARDFSPTQNLHVLFLPY